jgi:hypothetical protein
VFDVAKFKIVNVKPSGVDVVPDSTGAVPTERADPLCVAVALT